MCIWTTIRMDLQEVGCGYMDCIWATIRMDLQEVGCGYMDCIWTTIRMDLQEVGCGCMDWIGLLLGWISRRWDVGIWTGLDSY